MRVPLASSRLASDTPNREGQPSLILATCWVQLGMSESPSSAATELATSKATETLSQFVARVLNQLSLSAWLPSAALVLGATWILTLGAHVDATHAKEGTGGWAAVSASLEQVADIGVGGALLLFAAVVVLTTMTQAFSFEAIRFLEGYWGTSRVAEYFADKRTNRFATKAGRLRSRYQELTDRAWAQALIAIEDERSRALRAGETDNDALEWSSEQLTYLGARLRRKDTDVRLTRQDRFAALQIPWEHFAPADLLRRRVSVDKKLRDYPVRGRSLPTRLGNVLRAHEDRTGRREVETLALEAYDDLPLGVKVRHDEHRNRLDLYASLMFVELALIALALARFFPSPQPWFCAPAAVSGLILMIVTYRAAIASARIYGIMLLDIARRRPVPDQSGAAPTQTEPS